MGLVLCCTHLSEITLTIAANALHTFFFLKENHIGGFLQTDF